MIEAAIRRVLAPAAFVWKNDTGSRDLEQLPKELTVAFGALPEELELVENGIAFTAPLGQGQKTGWFYDQTRQSRARSRVACRAVRACSTSAPTPARGPSLRRRCAGACSSVRGCFAANALAAVQKNAAANGCEIGMLRDDAFDALAALAAAGRRFDAIVLDPPAFIKRRKEIPAGQAAYRKLNQLALRLLDDEGLLVSCSCSWHLAPEDLLGGHPVGRAPRVDRFVQVLHVGGQSPDHPLHPAIAETRYLKAFFCRVTPDG